MLQGPLGRAGSVSDGMLPSLTLPARIPSRRSPPTQSCGNEVHQSGVASPLLPGCPARAGSSGTLFRPSTKEVVMRTVLTFVALVVGLSAYAAWAAADDEKGDQKAGEGLAE